LLAYPNHIDLLNGDAVAMYLHWQEEYRQKIKDYIKKYIHKGGSPEGAGRGHCDSPLENSMFDFSEDEAHDMEL
jgi:hypothetical protein